MIAVAISKVLDEADIVEAFVRHTAAFVAHHVVLDNGSRDETVAILQALVDEGLPLTVFRARSVAFNEVAYNTALYRWAWARFRPDWVLSLDADEFIDDRGHPGGLAAALAAGGTSVEPTNLALSMTNYYPRAADAPDDLLVPRRIRAHAPVTDVHKMVVDGRSPAGEITLGEGAHYAARGGAALAATPVPGVTLAHYHERSAPQRVLKYLRGWTKVLAAGPATVAGGANYHYRGFWEQARATPGVQFAPTAVFLPGGADAGLIDDPIAYRGGALRYTPRTDPADQALRLMMDYVTDLAEAHGELVEAVPGARAHVARRAASIERVASSVPGDDLPAIPLPASPLAAAGSPFAEPAAGEPATTPPRVAPTRWWHRRR